MLRALIRDSLVYSLSSLLSKGLAIFLLPVYARVLSPGEFGVYDLIVSIGVLVNLTVAMEIVQGLSRLWADESNLHARTRLASTSLWFSLFMYGLFALVGLSAAQYLTILILGDAKFESAFRLGILFIAINGIYYLLLSQFRWELRSKAYGIVSITYALFTLVFALFFCIGLKMGLIGVMLAQLMSVLMATFLCLWMLRGTFGWVFDVTRLYEMLRFSAPLVPAGLAIFISLYVNRFALNHFGSLEDVGHFAIGSRIASFAMLLILGIQSALTPLVYHFYREPQTPNQISRLFSWFSAVALIGCLFLTLFSRELVLLFATADFISGAGVVVILAPSVILSQMYIFAPGIAIEKKTHWQLGVAILSALVSILGNWILVPIIGMWGAAVSTLFSSLVFFSCWVLLSQRLYWISYRWKSLVQVTLGFVGLAFLGMGLDLVDQTLFLVVLLKFLLLFLLFCLIVITGLIPLDDLQNFLRVTWKKFKKINRGLHE